MRWKSSHFVMETKTCVYWQASKYTLRKKDERINLRVIFLQLLPLPPFSHIDDDARKNNSPW